IIIFPSHSSLTFELVCDLSSLDSSSLRDPRNLRDIFIGCAPFLIVLPFGFALELLCQDSDLSSIDAGLLVWPTNAPTTTCIISIFVSQSLCTSIVKSWYLLSFYVSFWVK